MKDHKYVNEGQGLVNGDYTSQQFLDEPLMRRLLRYSAHTYFRSSNMAQLLKYITIHRVSSLPQSIAARTTYPDDR